MDKEHQFDHPLEHYYEKIFLNNYRRDRQFQNFYWKLSVASADDDIVLLICNDTGTYATNMGSIRYYNNFTSESSTTNIIIC